MFEKHGEFDSASEINRMAEDLFNAGDFEGIRSIAAENGIPSEYADAYCEGELPELCDRLTAAIGKLEMEEQEIVMVGVMEDWLHYIEAQCGESDQMAIAVRRKGKNLQDCLGAILLWSLMNQKKVDKGVLASAEKQIKDQGISLQKYGIEPRYLQYTRIGIPDMSTARQLIREYYLQKV
jgi:hypothetical protein